MTNEYRARIAAAAAAAVAAPLLLHHGSPAPCRAVPSSASAEVRLNLLSVAVVLYAG